MDELVVVGDAVIRYGGGTDILYVRNDLLANLGVRRFVVLEPGDASEVEFPNAQPVPESQTAWADDGKTPSPLAVIAPGLVERPTLLEIANEWLLTSKEPPRVERIGFGLDSDEDWAIAPEVLRRLESSTFEMLGEDEDAAVDEMPDWPRVPGNRLVWMETDEDADTIAVTAAGNEQGPQILFEVAMAWAMEAAQDD